MHVSLITADVVDYKFKQGEIFRRVKATTLVAMMLNVYEQHITVDQHEENVHEDERSETTELTHSEPARPSSRLHQCVGCVIGALDLMDVRLISGVGEIDKGNAQQTTDAGNASALPFLILDLRDADEFAKFHLFGGMFIASRLRVNSV